MENTYYQRKASSKIERQKGFALVFLITLLPLVLAALTFLYVGTTQIEIKSTLQQTCRAELMKAQKTASSLINTLMAINKLIAIVKWGEFLARIASYVTTPFPLLSLAIKGILAVAKTAKTAIPLIQKAILVGLGPGLEYYLVVGHRELSKILTAYSQKTTDLMILSNKLVFANYIRTLSVEPENPAAELTKYRLKKNFEDKQQLFLHWRYRLKASPALFKWAPWEQTFHGHCSATLKKEEPWEPTLYAGKFFWKFF